MSLCRTRISRLHAAWNTSADHRQNGPTLRKAPALLCAAGRCAAGDEEARQRLVLVCDDRGVLLLNRFPYTNGHLLIALREHGGDLASLRSEQRTGMMELATLGQELLAPTAHPQVFNLGKPGPLCRCWCTRPPPHARRLPLERGYQFHPCLRSDSNRVGGAGSELRRVKNGVGKSRRVMRLHGNGLHTDGHYS